MLSTIKKSFSKEKEKNNVISNRQLINENSKTNRKSTKSTNFSEKSLNKKRKIVGHNRVLTSIDNKKQILALDLYNNNKSKYSSNNYNHSHVINNTDANLNSLIKVNIKLNKKKQYTPMNKRMKKEKIINKAILNKEKSNFMSKRKEYSYKDNSIKKIILIQKWWKKKFVKKETKLKIEVLFYFIRRFIYKQIMKLLNKRKYILKYYFNKWNHKVNFKKILYELKIYKYTNIINHKTINIKRNHDLTIIKATNSSTGNKKHNYIKKFKQYNNNIFVKIDQRKKCEKTNKNKVYDYLYINKNDSRSKKKYPSINTFSPGIKKEISRKEKFSEKLYSNNKIHSSIEIIPKNQSTFESNKLNNLKIINNNNINTQLHKGIKKYNTNCNFTKINKNRIKDIIKDNKNHFNKNLKEAESFNENDYYFTDLLSNKNIKKEKIFFDNNITLKNSQRTNSKKILRKKYDLFFNELGNSKKSITNYEIILNTEPDKNNSNFNNINSNNLHFNNYYSKLDNNLITNDKNNKYLRLKKLDIYPLSFINEKRNSHKTNEIKTFFNLWKNKTIKRKILYCLIELSKKQKMKIFFTKTLLNILLNIFKKIILKIYFKKYKDIVTKKIIIKQLKIYFNKKIRDYSINANKQKTCDIINNININHYINYTHNDQINNNINTFIPKTTKNYNNIFNNSTNMNYNNYTPSYIPQHISYINNFDDINFFNSNINDFNFQINKNYNINNNNDYGTVFLDKIVKKKNKGNLTAQINQFLMVFNLLEQHKNNKTSLYNCFKKWKNFNGKILYENNTSNLNNIKINENVVNYKKIKVQNKNNKKNNKIMDLNLDYDTFRQYRNNNIYNNSLNKLCFNKFVNINNSNLFSDRQSNTVRNNEIVSGQSSNRNNMKIRYIDNINTNFADNSSESSILKNKINSEIIYQKKKLNSNHILNQNTLNNNNLIEENKIHFKKINKIEEREVHFNSLNKNNNKKAYNKIFNNINYFYNNTEIYDKVSNNTRKNTIQKRENIIKTTNYIFDYKYIFNNIKNYFSKQNKIINKKINKSFCGNLINNLED